MATPSTPTDASAPLSALVSPRRFHKRKKFDDEIVSSAVGLRRADDLDRSGTSIPMAPVSDVFSPRSSGAHSIVVLAPAPPKRREGALAGGAARNRAGKRQERAGRNELSRRARRMHAKWRPIDDLRLIAALQQGYADPEIIGIVSPFSQWYSALEIHERLVCLLSEHNKLAFAARERLWANMANVRSADVPWSPAELHAIMTELPSIASADVAAFIARGPPALHPCRSAGDVGSLYKRLLHLQQVDAADSFAMLERVVLESPPQTLCPDAAAAVLSMGASAAVSGHVLDLHSLEGRAVGAPLQDGAQAASGDRLLRARQLRAMVEAQSALDALGPLVESHRQASWGGGTLAVLRGYCLRERITAQVVTLGRWGRSGTGPEPADINLAVEAPCPKVSRLQAAIVLRGERFHLRNLGRALVYVNGRHIARGEQRALPHNACIEVAGLAFVFECNRVAMPGLASLVAARPLAAPGAAASRIQ